MARHVLDRPRHSGPRKTLQHGAAQGGDAHGFVAQRAVANHVVRAFHPHVEHGRVGAGDAHFGQVHRQGFGIGARGLDRAGRGNVIEPVERSAGGIGIPDRRLHPLDPPAFLVDGNEQPVAPVDRAQRIGQRAQLLAVFDVAAEDDVARRIGLAEKGALLRAEYQTGKAEDRRGHDGPESRSNARPWQAPALQSVWIRAI